MQVKVYNMRTALCEALDNMSPEYIQQQLLLHPDAAATVESCERSKAESRHSSTTFCLSHGNNVSTLLNANNTTSVLETQMLRGSYNIRIRLCLCTYASYYGSKIFPKNRCDKKKICHKPTNRTHSQQQSRTNLSSWCKTASLSLAPPTTTPDTHAPGSATTPPPPTLLAMPRTRAKAALAQAEQESHLELSELSSTLQASQKS